jgi:hypothetical protein
MASLQASPVAVTQVEKEAVGMALVMMDEVGIAMALVVVRATMEREEATGCCLACFL